MGTQRERVPLAVTSPPVIAPPPRVLGREYRALSGGLVSLIILIAFQYLAVATAMPVVARVLDGFSLYGLAFSGSMAASVITTLAGGRWSDVRGPVAPLWTGVAGFVAGLLIAGFAPTMAIMIVGRFVQGAGSGLFMVALYVLVAKVYPAAMHPRVFSLLSAAWVLPSIMGPAITGLVVEHAGWRWIFLGVPPFVVPAALLLWRGLVGRGAAPPRTRPESRGPSGAGFGTALAWGGVTAAGATLLQYGSGLGGRGLLLLAAGLLILGLALPRLLPPGTMRAARGLPTVVLLRGLAAGATFAAEVFVPLMLTGERGLSPTQAGLFLTGSVLSWSLASWIQGRGRYARKPLLRCGTALVASGIAGTSLLVFDVVPIAAGLCAWLVAGFGIGLVYPALSVLTLELSEPGEEGKNSSALRIGEAVMTVMAIAITGAVFAGVTTATWVYLVCFGLIAGQAALGTLAAGRVGR